MPLIHNNNTGIYAGVSRQAVDLRLPNYCEEMVNCYPSVQYGVRRRNPTQLISNDIIAQDNQFLHTYDRGLSGESEEQYVITIDNTNNLRVFDVQANAYRTVTYSGSALNYLQNSNPEIGFSAITIKDTTFIANKDIIPRMRGDESSGTINYSEIAFNSLGYDSPYGTAYKAGWLTESKLYTNLAPARIATYNFKTAIYKAANSLGAVITFTIDSVDYKYQISTRSYGYSIYPETVGEMVSNIYSFLVSTLSTSTYLVSMTTGYKIRVYKLDGRALSISHTITYPTDTPPALANFKTLVDTQNIGSSSVISGYTASTSTGGLALSSSYDKEAFVWIKSVSPDTAFPYTFTLTLKETNGTIIGTTTSNVTTSTGVASALATWADAVSGFTASSIGSVVKITRDDGTAFEVLVSDTYGNQASIAWKGSVTSMEDLPKAFTYKNTVVKIAGVNKDDDSAYWVKYDGNSWVEWRDPNMLYSFDDATMPHKLVRNKDFTFTLSTIDWDDILVGDENSQTIPEFVGNGIRDLFFVNGRLGVLTKNGITLSQQGNFYNFFRTTILALLDDSAISTYIDSSRSVGLEYAVELQGYIILFGDKLQFAIDANKPIAPASLSVKPISGFEINTNVKPLSVGDSVFFLVNKNGYSALMEMNQSTLSTNIRASDVSAHVPDYIDSDIGQLVCSPRDNVVILRSRSVADTLYVYKYFGTENEKAQMAWSRWTFAMDIKSVFVFDKELFIYGSRYDVTVPIEDFPLATTWEDSLFWLDETYWVDGELSSIPSFEKMGIDAYNVDGTFKDLGIVRYDSEIELSEWALTRSEQKEMRGALLIKTAKISSEDGSNFYLVVEDKERGTSRTIPAIYTVDRKPFISGNSKNMRIKIVSSDGDGFQINAISLEGQYNVRSKRV